MDVVSLACKEILQQISIGKIADTQGLARAKIQACREFGISKPPSNSEILAAATVEERKKIIQLLRLKPVRSISGVSVITVMPKPYPCPKEEPCIYCPGGPSSGTPQSYTGREPAAMRAIQHNFDPYQQVKGRIEQLRAIGHDVDKVELIIFGGTLTAYPQDYLEWFVTQCLNAMSSANAKTIEEAQVAAENSKIRISDIAFETRPDYCKESHVDLMLRLGATRVELGVQTVHEDIYKLVDRGHTVEDVVEATRIARDAGFAVTYHVMLGLVGSSFDRDLEMFRLLFENQDFMPDALKVYPCLVLKDTKLYELWKSGKFEPIETSEAIELLAMVKPTLPKWVRIQRIQRDIPANLIEAGVKAGNLRDLVRKRLEQMGTKCRCIRCREVGHLFSREKVIPEVKNVELLVERYRASMGEEIFLSFEDVKNNILLALLRLRIPSQLAHRPEVDAHTTLVRELHVYGELVPVGESARECAWQHRGLGSALLAEAEKISKEEYDAKKISVLAGIGARQYYLKHGYAREGPYVAKTLD
ncbi:MAG: tRNA uridine(34) 5-carboxymethylaminomethyl modification radical SAM/GNAT enzyme Elp3 [Candidatus Hadarchaeum sp.]|jgi:elongator complex protein 3|nr:tRNA uridine(34) 5-carboxymethylaminomethyl modification radical SAM/GNAT enzyme Elp3 [Candidatus Hadarchaeum sp.]